MPRPFLHKKFNIIVNPIMIINLKNAVLYRPLNVSMTIWVNVNPMYKITGVQ